MTHGFLVWRKWIVSGSSQFVKSLDWLKRGARLIPDNAPGNFSTAGFCGLWRKREQSAQTEQTFIPKNPTNMASKNVICSDCKAPFQYDPMFIGEREYFPRQCCPACSEIRLADSTKELASKEAKLREDQWFKVCPPLYRDTDIMRINQRCAEAALTWDVASTRGMGIVGETGAGKTRALFFALRRAFDSGLRCLSISHNSFSRVVQTAFSGDGLDKANAQEHLKNLHRVPVILLDDLGKPPPTERADAELEELIEVRTSNLLPILWSANGSSAWLIKRMGPDRGEPLVRRLSEFSEVIAL